MRSLTKKNIWASLLLVPLFAFFAGNMFAGSPVSLTDDEIPDTTLPVARVSFIRGDAQIRRAESEDWEKLTLNLPIVEGDEIATERGTRADDKRSETAMEDRKKGGYF